MIVSDLESLLARLMLGGVIAALDERRLSVRPGTTPAAAEELEAGGAV